MRPVAPDSHPAAPKLATSGSCSKVLAVSRIPVVFRGESHAQDLLCIAGSPMAQKWAKRLLETGQAEEIPGFEGLDAMDMVSLCRTAANPSACTEETYMSRSTLDASCSYRPQDALRV
mmetsp:Transcript_20319/g.61679  ORF Transcript_20319/g.61679 Transcript_20319/m.61679 type:complete len:118 (-) Transcript_20319:474-827(-)